MSSTTTMRAAHITEYSKPLSFVTVPIPDTPIGRILVRVTACSLCMSDLAGWAGHIEEAKLPYCGGHEPVGVVAKIGLGVVGFSVGERVGFMPASDTCHSCQNCVSGNHRFCKQKRAVGFNGPYGGWSEYCVADPLSTVKIPDELADEEAAPLLCAGVTAYGAIKKAAQVQLGGSLINIIGCGGVGHLAIMYAKAMGFKVTAFDIADDKLKLALDSGANKALNSLTINDEEIVTAASTIVISGAVQAYELAFKATAKSGRVIAVGVPHSPVPVSIMGMVLNDQSLIATNQGSKAELQAALQIAADTKMKPVFVKKNMEDINEGFMDMVRGNVVGRYVYSWQ